MQLSETSADGRGISERIGKPWTTNGDVPVDRLMWQAVCVVGKRLAGSSSSSSSNINNNNSICLPVINLKHSFIGLEATIIYFSQFYITKVKIYLHMNCAKGVEVSGKNYFSPIWAILGVQNSPQSQIWIKFYCLFGRE